ncbi:putative MFS-type transporter [Lachnellula suecica]|uniref:Putative MFS-type transporter n=1 Tax=Lachnellula suecica TaxID=602035 RepID=A0A8T9C421_9HELO|nr:putative MFS-type transporter [Lachnellula suecica]
MTTDPSQEKPPSTPNSDRPRSFFARNSASDVNAVEPAAMADYQEEKEERPTRWGMGVLNDPITHEVPGSILLMTGDAQQPLGLRNAPARTSGGSLPPQPMTSGTIQTRRPSRQEKAREGKKTTADGTIVLDPQPDESHNDPLNWPSWRRDFSLLSLGLYCMAGGGMTPILAAGFTNVAATYHVTVPAVALTTGLYMMGLGVGSVIASPTAILYGKRPVYLVSAILFVVTSVWCALSPNYSSLVVARVIQGIAISPVECLPSATIAEIFFLHERAYRIGIYTLLLLSGKNLVPLVSAAIIQSLSWRWVFWIISMIVGFLGVLLFFFLPESFWDRTPRPKSRKSSKNVSKLSILSHRHRSQASPIKEEAPRQVDGTEDEVPRKPSIKNSSALALSPTPAQSTRNLHVEFVGDDEKKKSEYPNNDGAVNYPEATHLATPIRRGRGATTESTDPAHEFQLRVAPSGGVPPTPGLHNLNSPFYNDLERNSQIDYLTSQEPNTRAGSPYLNNDGGTSFPALEKPLLSQKYTNSLRERPPLTFVQQLKPYNGRLVHDKWLKVAIRPFILFAYPAVLWSAGVYACAIGWLIVLSESVAVVFRSKDTYNFSALSTGLIYISPFIGGVLGTAVAGKLSDVIVRAMSRRNGGLYEPEFRLVMAAPVAITTVIGLMGFGWSAQIHDSWIVPTVFFGVISFGCSLGSTTAITFCVDSYRQYAGEALVTLNFSKNIFHGLVFSLFFNEWLAADGSRMVFIWLGIIQLILMAFTVPMYIFGKRARMWTYRKNLMEKF